MSDFLPPVTAKLLGDISDYLDKLAAAGAAMDAFAKSVPDKLGAQSPRIGQEGAKAAEQYGKRFDDTVTKRVDDTFKRLPDKITGGGVGKKLGQKLGDDTGKGFFSTLTDAFSGQAGFDGLMSVLGPVLVGASPAIAALIGAAVETGLGLGFIGIGAIALKSNPAIVSAFTGLKSDIGAVFKDAANPLIGPFVGALHTLDAAFIAIGPGLRETFAALAPAVAPLTQGLAGFVREIMPGLESAVKASAPVIEKLGDELPGFGSALGTFIKDIGDTAPAAIHVIEIGFLALDGVLRGLGVTLKILAGIWDTAYHAWALVSHEVGNAAHSFASVPAALHAIGTGFESVTGSTNRAVAATQHVNDRYTWTTLVLDKYTTELDRAGRGIDGVNQKTVTYTVNLDRAGRGIDGLGNKTDLYITSLDRAGRGVDGARQNMDTYVSTLDKAGRGVDGLSTVTDGYVYSLDRVGRGIDGVDKLTDHLATTNSKAAQSDRNWGDSMTYTADQLSAMKQQLDANTISADTLAEAMTDKLLNGMLGIANAELGVHQALTQVSDSLRQNGRNFDENTKKGQANMQALLQDIAANQRLYDEQINSGMGAAQAAANYDTNTQALERQLRKAGLTEAQIKSLVGQYAAVPDNVNTAIATHGLTEAIQNLTHLLIDLNHLDGSRYGYTVVAKTVYQSDYQQYRAGERQQFGGIQHFDVGGMLPTGAAGIVNGGGPYVMFGEPGTGASTEGFLPRSGISQSRAAGLLAEMAGWYGFGLVTPQMIAGMMAGLGGRSQAPPPAASGGAAALAPGYVPIVVNLGGTQMAAVHAALIPVAQQQKQRSGFTGLA